MWMARDGVRLEAFRARGLPGPREITLRGTLGNFPPQWPDTILREVGEAHNGGNNEFSSMEYWVLQKNWVSHKN